MSVKRAFAFWIAAAWMMSTPLWAKPVIIDLEGGVEASDVLDAPKAAGSEDPKACRVSFRSTKLFVDEVNRYARAVYGFNEKCEPVLQSIFYAREPTAARVPAPVDAQSATAELKPRKNGAGTLGNYACTIEVYEQDVIGVTMITLRNGTSWETQGGEILRGQVNGYIFRNLDWWWVEGKPDVAIGYVREPYTAASAVSGNFHCNGASGAARYVCNGPSYRIRLRGDLLFDGGGSCSGQGSYSGTVVPAGRVTFEVWR